MKPSLPQGTRDFAADTLYRRKFIIQTIQSVFELYGFEPLETPSIENLETLMGKYGEEGDKLIFKILNNGLENPSKRESAIKNFENILEGKNNKNITERALRYDLTIPFARYMAMNQGKLTIPFKRFQVQNVWRADRPQKGRYREFLQCDADIAGTYSLIADAELACIYVKVFNQLNIDVSIKINNRKMLYALAELTGNIENLNAITVAIDKLDKIGLEKVKEELSTSGLSEKDILLIEKFINIQGTNTEKLEEMSAIAGDSATGRKGIAELSLLLEYIGQSFSNAGKQTIEVDFSLARGLHYYTGTIFEVKAKNVSMGSIGGGGRYDDLTGLFGVAAMPGVGISFGVDRIYDVMEELKLFPENINKTTQVLFFNLGEKESLHAFRCMQILRDHGVSAELFYENAKLEKQFKYASKKNIAYAVIIGSREIEEKTCIIKDLSKGEQQTISESHLPGYFEISKPI